jgi:hypothetical protein
MFALACCLFGAAHGGCSFRQNTARPWLKPVGEWSKHDAAQVWYDSPWVRAKIVTSNYVVPRSLLEFRRETDLGDPSRSYTFVDWASAPSQGEPKRDEYRARWVSSTTMCLAIQRRSPASKPRRDACSPATEIRILVDELQGFSSNESALSQNSYLLPRKLGVKVRPRVERAGWGKIIFTFPRRARDGRPLIQAGERSVEFVYSDGRKRWEIRFDPEKMVGPNGPDW